MTIHKASAKGYASVNPESVARYIKEYNDKITLAINGNFYNDKLANCNKTQLNAIAAELETVKKRLDYILHGRY